MRNIQQVGKVGNYYGGIFTAIHDGKYYWIIENYDTNLEDFPNNIDEWEEISEELYKALLNHQCTLEK